MVMAQYMHIRGGILKMRLKAVKGVFYHVTAACHSEKNIQQQGFANGHPLDY